MRIFEIKDRVEKSESFDKVVSKKTITNQKTRMHTTILSSNLQVNPDHLIAASIAPSAFVGDFLVVPSYCEGFKQVGSPRYDSRQINVGSITNEFFVGFFERTYTGKLRTDDS